MKRLAALCGALVLTLAMAVPAAAAQKVWIEEFSGYDEFEVEVDFDNPFWWEGWECTQPIYYGGTWTGDIWLWYPNSVDEADMMPDDRAWPWIKGKAQGHGIDYFSSEPNMSGTVISGKYKGIDRFYDHVIDNPETWKIQSTGKFWGVNAPGAGTVFHESGNFRGTMEVVFEGGEVIEENFNFVRFRGNSMFDIEELCDYLGAGPANYRNGG